MPEETKAKIHNRDYIELKRFCTVKKATKSEKKIYRMCGNISSDMICNQDM
jgi:hypothetical protein